MPQSLVQVYLHIILSTKSRARLIAPASCGELHSYLAETLKQWDTPAVLINSVEDHVHILCRLSKNYAIKKVIEEIKKSSSKWAKGKFHKSFYWQAGYGAFSVSPSRLDAVQRYINGQSEHHKHESFQDEFRRFLKEYNIEYDEEHVWD